MNLADIIYLKNVLGEEEARNYLKADEEKLKMLVRLLKKTSIKRSLVPETFNEFCNKIAYGKYGKVYAEVLCRIGKFRIETEFPMEYVLFLIYYIDYGYNNERRYRDLFKK